jgi:serine/threonine protein kinase
MELSGPSLHKLLHDGVAALAHGGFDHARRLGVAADVAAAMVYLHEARDPAVIHRDIKSANVLVDATTGAAKVRKMPSWPRSWANLSLL